MSYAAWLILLVSAFLSAGCGIGIYIDTPYLQSIEIRSDGDLSNLSIGQTHKLSVIALRSDDSEKDVSNEVSWSLSDEGIITIDGSGTIKALKPGSTEVGAIHPDDESLLRTTYLVSVSPTLMKIELVSETDEILEESTLAIEAIGYYNNDTKANLTQVVNWSTSDKDLAQFDSDYIFHSKQQGKVTVTANHFAHTAQKEITVLPVYERIVASPKRQPYFEDDLIEVNVIAYLVSEEEIDVSEETKIIIDPPEALQQQSNNTFRVRQTGSVTFKTEFKGRFSEFTIDIHPELYLNVDANSPAEHTLSWNEQDADSYILYWDTKPEVNTDSSAIRDIQETSYTQNGVNFATNYYYRLAFVKGESESKLGDVRKVTPMKNEWVKPLLIKKGGQPFSVIHPTSVTIDDKIHIIGGEYTDSFGVKHISNSHIVYDPSTNTFSDADNISTAISEAAACSVGGKIYIFGGKLGDGSYTNELQIVEYDSEIAQWTSTTQFLNDITPVGISTCAVAADKIYFFGGKTDTGVSKQFFSFNTATDFSFAVEILTTPQELNARYGHGLVAIDNTLYLLGGTNFDDTNGIQSDVWKFSLTTHAWQLIPDTSYSRMYASYFSHQGKLYAIGGSNSDGEILKDNSIFVPEDDIWLGMPSLPAPLTKADIALANNTAYIIGGEREDGQASNDMFRFNLEKGIFSEKAPFISNKRFYTVQDRGDDSLLLFGGIEKDDSSILDEQIEIYSASSNRWGRLETVFQDGRITKYIPILFDIPRKKLASARIGSEIYLIGGANQYGEVQSYVNTYNVIDNSWRSLRALPISLRETAVCVHNENVYVFGGQTGIFPERESDKSFRYDSRLNLWKEIASMPEAKYQHQCISLDNRIYIIGGEKKDETGLSRVDIYNPYTNEWKTGTPLNNARTRFAAHTINGSIIVMGGKQNRGLLDSVESYSPLLDEWTELESLPSPRLGIHAKEIRGEILIFSNEDNSSKVDVFH